METTTIERNSDSLIEAGLRLLTWRGNACHICLQFMRHKTEDGKDDKTSEKTGQTVANSNNKSISGKKHIITFNP